MLFHTGLLTKDETSETIVQSLHRLYPYIYDSHVQVCRFSNCKLLAQSQLVHLMYI